MRLKSLLGTVLKSPRVALVLLGCMYELRQAENRAHRVFVQSCVQEGLPESAARALADAYPSVDPGSLTRHTAG